MIAHIVAFALWPFSNIGCNEKLSDKDREVYSTEEESSAQAVVENDSQ
jgi:hypothetical protein